MSNVRIHVECVTDRFQVMQSIIPTTQVLYVKYLTVDVMIVIAAVVNLNNMVLFQNL